MPGIVINYRREDSRGSVGRLDEQLAAEFGRDLVFRDIDTFEPGEDYVDKIEKVVGECDVFIAVIGPYWKAVTDKKGSRRLDDPGDLVRLEIATALNRSIRVIPVLVNGADMPTAEELPADLSKLARRHAVEISDRRFRADVDDLINHIRPLLSHPEREPVVEPAPTRAARPQAEVGRPAPMAAPGTEAERAFGELLAERARSVHVVQPSPTPVTKSTLDWSAKINWTSTGGPGGPLLVMLGLFLWRARNSPWDRGAMLFALGVVGVLLFIFKLVAVFRAPRV